MGPCGLSSRDFPQALDIAQTTYCYPGVSSGEKRKPQLFPFTDPTFIIFPLFPFELATPAE